MADPKQYAKNGICRFENFPERLNNPTEINMGTTIRESFHIQWYMGLKRVPDQEGDHFRVYIRSVCAKDKARISIYVLINFLKRFGKRRSRGKHTIEANVKVFTRKRIKISDVLDNPYEWLKDGALEIEYGVHLEAFHSENGIWNFNFRDKPFNRRDFSVRVIMRSGTDYERELYCNNALLQFHSQFLSSKFSVDDPIFSNRVLPLNSDFNIDYTEIALQIAHGVLFDCCKIVEIAEKLKLRNVSRYCERRMIECEDERSFCYIEYSDDMFWELAIEYDLNHLLAHMLKQNDWMKRIRYRDIELMSRNSMMLIIAKFMEDSV
ncbi:Protein CBG23691 [Caenorhabditis briggsae]|uniref:Protein CBG23691 n=1 Tax=Caenorhabditis briggsae TaxID=6238 RepID=A8WJ32_CAEBR|nr:Protein CBG23691 [Caenorhabditis briggsae]CAP20476.2 Protein CBG23691 [Caenorhabditis briggsae]